MSRFTERSLAYGIIVTLALAGAALVYWMYGNNTAQAQGTYELVMTFPESGEDGDENFGETFAPCRNQGNCNFSCGPSTVGRGCSTLVCSGSGNGDAAYFYTHSYVCQYTPPPTPVCTPDASCAANTCSTDTCTATASDCSQYQIGGSKNCSIPCEASNSCGQTNYGTIVNGSCSVSAPSESGCPVDPPVDPTCTNGSPGPYPSCPLPDPTCTNGSPGPYPSCPLPDPTCTNGSAGPYPSCPLPDPGDGGDGDATVSANLSANPISIVSGNSSTLSWSSSNASSCTGTGFSTGGATSGTRSVSPTSNTTYIVSCTNGSNTDTDDATISVSGGACSGAGPVTITASPNRVQAGAGTSVTLSWTGSNVGSAQCTVTNLGTGSTVKTTTVSSCGVNDSVTVSGITAQTTYRLTCGALVKDVVVNIIPRYEEF
jgi:hypothetical protein